MPYLAVNLIFFFYLLAKLANDTFGNFNKISGFGSMAKVPISMRETLSKAFTKSIIGIALVIDDIYSFWALFNFPASPLSSISAYHLMAESGCATDGTPKETNSVWPCQFLFLLSCIAKYHTHPTMPPSLSFNGAELSATAT